MMLATTTIAARASNQGGWTCPRWLLGVVGACSLLAPQVALSAERVDELTWLRQLQERRPDLVSQHAGGVAAPGWLALVLHPQWRGQLLDEGSSWESILGAEYSADLRARDRLWVSALRAAHKAIEPSPRLRAGGVDERVYVGYRIGSPGPWRDGDGFVRKVYLSFETPERDLGAGQLAGFAQHLAGLGFDGAFKVDLRPGLARFTYNQLILYLDDASSVECAEAAALAFFGDGLSTVGRGVDPPPAQGAPALNWHQFLLTGGYPSLPLEVRTWLEVSAPLSADLTSCESP